MTVKGKILLLSTVLLLGLQTVLSAQVTRIDFQAQQKQLLDENKAIQTRDYEKTLQQRIDRRRQLEEGIFELNALERKVDPETYIIGPGDVFAVQILTLETIYFENSVNPEGNLDLPGVGTIYVDGMVLAEARSAIKAALTAMYSQAEVSVTLSAVRSFIVFLTGEVQEPGAVAVKASERICDVILRIGGVKKLGKFHDITVERRSGEVLTFNGYDYTLRGDLKANPHVMAGDIIRIPRARIPEETITVQGASGQAGLVPLQTNESLRDLLSRLADFDDKVNIDFVTVTRIESGKEKNYRIDISGRNTDLKSKDMALHPGDIINLAFLPEIYVYGQVPFPGNYPYIAGYQVIDYLGLAGGNTPEGSNKAYVLRNSEKIKDLSVTLQRGDIIVVPRSVPNIIFGDLSALTLVSTFVSTILSIILITK